MSENWVLEGQPVGRWVVEVEMWLIEYLGVGDCMMSVSSFVVWVVV